MSQTNLQVPIDIRIRDRAKKVAARDGFSSLQEMIRVLLAQVVNDRLRVGFTSEDIPLSKKAEARYRKLLSDRPSKQATDSVDELLSQLEA